MKIYLSKYWIKNSFFILGMIAVIVFSTVAFCVFAVLLSARALPNAPDQ